MGVRSVGDAPIYRRVAWSLAARVRARELSPGSRLPSERELAADHGISRLTARAAVDLLARRGLIERKERMGAFVARSKIAQDLNTVAGFSEQLGARGVAAGAEVIEARTAPAGDLDDAEVASRLGLSRGARVHVVVRRRTGDGEPLVLEESYFPARLFRGLLGEDLTGSLYALMRERYCLGPARSRQEIEPTLLDPEAAAALGARPDVPALRVTRVAWEAGGTPIEFARDLHRGDRLLFVSEVSADGRGEEAAAKEGGRS